MLDTKSRKLFHEVCETKKWEGNLKSLQNIIRAGLDLMEINGLLTKFLSSLFS
jgi:biotin synthase-like enzyme